MAVVRPGRFTLRVVAAGQ